MLTHLSIQNYALIDKLAIDFSNGFSVITGETGAGKSIILGALQLILGQRAEQSAIKDQQNKCIIEGHFDISPYALQPIFSQNDLDYEPITIFRRELAPTGKSRAFVNDTPVSLTLLRELASKLIDIHSQNNQTEIETTAFQRIVVDTIASNAAILTVYQAVYKKLQITKKELATTREIAATELKELDYHLFQLAQFDEAKLILGEEEELEREQKSLSHAEEIKNALYTTSTTLESENGICNTLKETLRTINKVANFNQSTNEIAQRLESCLIELEDIAAESDAIATKTEDNPQKLITINQRLALIFDLKNKHQKQSIEELLVIEQQLREKISFTSTIDQKIVELQKQVELLTQELAENGSKLSETRKLAIPQIDTQVTENLKNLSIPQAKFEVLLTQSKTYDEFGNDDIIFMFSANKNHPIQPLSLVASGGERSRLMLVIKWLVAKHTKLPTVIFDEIDTGISGEVARKLAYMIESMAQNMQVISITHLPQVASLGKQHYKVFKSEINDKTTTQLSLLDYDQRVSEIAEMIGGKNITEATRKSALELLERKI